MSIPLARRLSSWLLLCGALVPAAHAQVAPVPATDASAPWTLPLSALEDLMRRELFDPSLLDGPGYASLRKDLQALLDPSAQRKQFVEAFNAGWRKGPSSHVRLQHAPADAAEMARRFEQMDAELGAGRAQVFGERTAGQMLSQRLFDLPEQLLLFVPVADYHAWHSGRIEGGGVTPTRTLPAEQALDAALAEAAR